MDTVTVTIENSMEVLLKIRTACSNSCPWHHRLNEHEIEQALGDGEGQGSLACYSPWGKKKLKQLRETLDSKEIQPVHPKGDQS